MLDDEIREKVQEMYTNKTTGKENRKLNKIYFAPTRENAVIPSKRKEDAGYDVYAYLDSRSYLIIQPHKTEAIPTGIASAFDKKYYMQIHDRGSLGSKGITYAAGVIDSGYRGEWLICLTNTTNKPFVIYDKERISDIELGRLFQDVVLYPSEKAIAQAVLHEVPVVEVGEIDYEDLLDMSSERGEGKLGSSGK